MTDHMTKMDDQRSVGAMLRDSYNAGICEVLIYATAHNWLTRKASADMKTLAFEQIVRLVRTSRVEAVTDKADSLVAVPRDIAELWKWIT